MVNESFSGLRRWTTTLAVIAHYALPLEGFWINTLVMIGEAPSLSQTGCEAYSYFTLGRDNAEPYL